MNALLRLLSGLGVVLCFTLLSARAETPAAGLQPIVVKTSLEVRLPEKLRALLLEKPMVRCLVTVDEESRLVEYLAVEATHHELLERAGQAVREAKFEAATVSGRAVQSTAEVRVTFFDPEQRALQDGLVAQPFGSSSADAVSRRVYANAKERHGFRQSDQAELDAPLAMTAGKLMVLADDEGRTASGRCVVDYYVDHLGQPRIPRIISSDNDTVARSALLTLQQLRFAPPTRDGQPTCVKVRQPFIYEGGAGPADS